jgi:hypothetical protein
MSGGVDLSGGALAAGLAVGFAGLAAIALSQFARPANFAGRVDALENRIEAAESVLKSRRGIGPYPAGAICEDGPASAADALKARVQSAVSTAGITLGNLTATATPGPGDAAIVTVFVQFQANGRYDAVIGMLGVLSRQRPAIFVDAADLTSKVSSVDLSFQGRIWCSARG